MLLNFGSPGRPRSSDPRINSPLLYQLSYWGIKLSCLYYIVNNHYCQQKSWSPMTDSNCRCSCSQSKCHTRLGESEFIFLLYGSAVRNRTFYSPALDTARSARVTLLFGRGSWIRTNDHGVKVRCFRPV
jgi:hypothetical protein